MKVEYGAPMNTPYTTYQQVSRAILYLLYPLIPIIGNWSNPQFIGQCIPPASSFSMEKMSNNRAVIFGGAVNEGTISNTVYLMDVSVNAVVNQSALHHHYPNVKGLVIVYAYSL